MVCDFILCSFWQQLHNEKTSEYLEEHIMTFLGNNLTETVMDICHHQTDISFKQAVHVEIIAAWGGWNERTRSMRL